jgi:hypothetical protein
MQSGRLGKSLKIHSIPFSDLLPDYKGVSCNPAGQANFLAGLTAELHIFRGLCLFACEGKDAKASSPG